MRVDMDSDQFNLEECLQGDTGALELLRDKYQRFLVSMLISKGASPSEAEDVVADLWGNCVGDAEGGSSLLSKYRGRSPVKNWLATIAIRRFYDFRRKNRTWLTTRHSDETESQMAPRATALPDPIRESALTCLLRDSLEKAFAACPPETILMLRLVYIHQLTQREVGRMWAWHESKVSRTLKGAMNDIEAVTLHQMKQFDPRIELSWQDFLDLCDTDPTVSFS